MRRHAKSPGRAGWALLLLLAAAGGRAAETEAGTRMQSNVSIIRTGAWAQGDAAREGASEFVILMEIARLRHEGAHGGLIAVGDRRGLFSAGTEEVLRHAVLRGVPVVKLARSGRVLPAPHGLFLDGGNLSEEAARQVLARCLTRYGGLPSLGGSAAAGATATRKLRARLQVFQQEFALAAGTQVALR